MRKIVFLASGNGGTLKFIYFAIQKLHLDFEINCVIADRYCGAYEFATDRQIPAKIINYSKNNDFELLDLLKKIEADIVITNIHKVISKTILDTSEAKFINLHYSLLPSFAGLIGMKTVDEARILNCQFIGATCHLVNEKLDGGKILTQGVLSVDWKEDNKIIYDRIFKIACFCLLNYLLTEFAAPILQQYSNNSSIGNFNPPLSFNENCFNDYFWNEIKIL